MSNERSVVVAAQAPDTPFNSLHQHSERTPDEPSTCVICLEPRLGESDRSPLRPCRFRLRLPRCVAPTTSFMPSVQIRCQRHQVRLRTSDGPKVFVLPLPRYESAPSLPPDGNISRGCPRSRIRAINARGQHQNNQDASLEHRRKVYKEKLYSLHVGSNPFSRYRNLNPQAFQQDETLVRRAKIWIRRELQVFDFLDPASAREEPSRRPARNAEFLGVYILAVLKSIDIRGSAGQAEELLQEFLGRDNARLFLHELGSWLRSPYENYEIGMRPCNMTIRLSHPRTMERVWLFAEAELESESAIPCCIHSERALPLAVACNGSRGTLDGNGLRRLQKDVMVLYRVPCPSADVKLIPLPSTWAHHAVALGVQTPHRLRGLQVKSCAAPCPY